MKKISIIGSESFLAKNFINYISKNEEYQVYCYDFIEKSDNEHYLQIDFSDKESVSKINFDVDSIIVFIGKTGTVNGFSDYELFIKINEIFLLNILDCYVKKSSNARIIYPSTRLIFKASDIPVNENSERELKSVYAITKSAAESYLELYNHTYNLKYTILRICTPYGSLIDNKGNYGTFEIFYNQAKEKGIITIFGDGNQEKTYTQIEDICEAFTLIINKEEITQKSYNLGGQKLSINNVADSIARKFEASIEHVEWPTEYKSVDGGSVVFDSKRFDNEFNMSYRPVIDFNE